MYGSNFKNIYLYIRLHNVLQQRLPLEFILNFRKYFKFYDCDGFIGQNLNRVLNGQILVLLDISLYETLE